MSLAVCSGKRAPFTRGCTQFLLDLWTTFPQCYVARVDKSNSRQTTTCSAPDNVFTNLLAVFIDQVSGAEECGPCSGAISQGVSAYPSKADECINKQIALHLSHKSHINISH